MKVDEGAWYRLWLKLDEVLGPDEAATLMELLAPERFGQPSRATRTAEETTTDVPLTVRPRPGARRGRP